MGIVLVESPDSSEALLVRQPSYPEGMYTCVAGFVDVGETLEECVRREVAEEAGVKVGSVRTIDTQHWPFPNSSLMVGCIATADPESPGPDPGQGEIEDARWFPRNDVNEAFLVASGNEESRSSRRKTRPPRLCIPPKQALAHQLIKVWLQRRKP